MVLVMMMMTMMITCVYIYVLHDSTCIFVHTFIMQRLFFENMQDTCFSCPDLSPLCFKHCLQ